LFEESLNHKALSSYGVSAGFDVAEHGTYGTGCCTIKNFLLSVAGKYLNQAEACSIALLSQEETGSGCVSHHMYKKHTYIHK
jgi:hypothetical protein